MNECYQICVWLGWCKSEYIKTKMHDILSAKSGLRGVCGLHDRLTDAQKIIQLWSNIEKNNFNLLTHFISITQEMQETIEKSA